MGKQVHCDQFRQEQFVPAYQVMTLLTVYVATRDERSANQGLGCSVKDMFTGEEKKLKIDALLKMGVRFPDGKRVKACKLHGGETYTLLGTPVRSNYGVFIVPRGRKYKYLFDGQQLAPGTCVLWDGRKSRVIGYRTFRKFFIMQPNPVSAGRMKAASQQPLYRPMPQGFVAGGAVLQAPIQQPPAAQRFAAPSVQNIGGQQAQRQTVNNQNYFVAVGRVLHGGELVELVLYDGRLQVRMPVKQCIAYAERGFIRNVKSVTRNGTTFLSGNGISLETLPYIEV